MAGSPFVLYLCPSHVANSSCSLPSLQTTQTSCVPVCASLTDGGFPPVQPEEAVSVLFVFFPTD